ncbi:YARHG domain-containing protein [Eggerthellaceae bacterium zg-887]|uniref:YARHG domain-containing protein n=1 Tax=Xiamenia xianingshaonis TaxID=2682776 RepID=UPI00140AB581|nr:YARHG domain-containing protein [Xiamenia xianingshaonis]NHM16319.1 YARHG domain-containing protein [Xiamenia xianingshaonis]
MFCPNCNERINSTQRFCPHCGARNPAAGGGAAEDGAADVGRDGTQEMPPASADGEAEASENTWHADGANSYQSGPYGGAPVPPPPNATTPMPPVPPVQPPSGAPIPMQPPVQPAPQKNSPNVASIVVLAAAAVLLLAVVLVVVNPFGGQTDNETPVVEEAPAASAATEAEQRTADDVAAEEAEEAQSETDAASEAIAAAEKEKAEAEKAKAEAEKQKAEAEKEKAEAEAEAARKEAEAAKKSAEQAQAQSSQAPKPNNFYILPDSSSRVYSYGELDSLSTYDLFLARNEIFARYGRIFQSDDLNSYFNSQSWYDPRYTPEAFDNNWLNSTERANVDTMLQIEQSRNSPYV